MMMMNMMMMMMMMMELRVINYHERVLYVAAHGEYDLIQHQYNDDI